MSTDLAHQSQVFTSQGLSQTFGVGAIGAGGLLIPYATPGGSFSMSFSDVPDDPLDLTDPILGNASFAIKVDLSGLQSARVFGLVSDAYAGMALGFRYDATGGGTYHPLGGGELAIDLATLGWADSGALALPLDAQQVVEIHPFLIGGLIGSGVVAPLWIQFT